MVLRTLPRCVLPLVLIVLLGAAAMAQSPAPSAAPPASSEFEDITVERAITRVSFDQIGTRREEIEIALRVNTPAGVQQAGTVTIPFRRDATSLHVTHVRVRKPDGSVVETPLTDTFDLPAPVTQAAPTYTDLYLRHINVQALQPGDVLEYAWEAIEPSLIAGHFWYEYDIERAPFGGRRVLEISWPSQLTPIVKSPGLEPEVTRTDGRVLYRWVSSETEPEATEENPERADIRISSFHDWIELGDAIGALWRGRAEVTPAIQDKALELTADLTTNEDRVRALYHFVSSDIRYVAVAVGLGRIQPNDATTVLANGFGDCKDKHILLEALLRAIGIDATPALIDPGVELDPELPSMTAFTHVITRVDLGLPEPVWLDTTFEVAPFGLLVGEERNARVLTLPGAGRPELATTPADPIRPTFWHTDTTGTLSSDGQLEATVLEEFSGDIEVMMRSVFRSVGRANWQQVVEALPLPQTRPGRVSDLVVSQPEATEAPFRLEYRYTVDAFVDWADGVLRPPTPLDVSGSSEQISESDRPDSSVELALTSRLTLPTDVELVDGAGSEFELSEASGLYRFQWTLTGRTLDIERRLVQHPAEDAGDDLTGLRRFMEEVRSAPSTIRVRRLTPWGWGDSATIDWYGGTDRAAEKLLRTAADIGRRGDYQEAIASVRRLLEVEPDNGAAWQMLAWAQFASGARERAIETLRRRAPVTSSASLLKYYALRLGDMNRRDEAIDIWKVGAERFPDDREFPLYLGEALLAAGRHSEALEVLLPLAGRQQLSARYQMATARAHLGVDETDAAIAALLRSAELDESPSHSNNVAWMLADRGLALDEAYRLAARAVAATTDAINRLSLDTLDDDGLRLMSVLAMYWDTLGWVHFHRAEREQAVRYLEAAWQLAQGSVHSRNVASYYEAGGDAAMAARYRTFADAVDDAARVRAILASDDGATNQALTDARAEMERMRTHTLPAPAGARSSTDVLVAIGSDGRVRDASVIGDTGATALLDSLTGLAIGWSPPDSALTQIIRRGRVTCVEGAETCSLVLLPVPQATTVAPKP